MKRFKNWLITNFLPWWAKEAVLDDNRKLERRIEKLERENRELKIYIRGADFGRRDMLELLRSDREE